MDARDHFQAAEAAIANGDALTSIAHAVMSWAALLGADAEAADLERDLFDPATRAPVLHLAKTAAAAADAPAATAETPTT
jgi:hypothetical protein